MERWKEIIEDSHSEYFKSKKKDLSGIIHETLQKQREYMKENMKRFTYFQEWSEELIEECTRLSKLKFFESNDIIYASEDFDQNSYVYFILEGTCYIMEDLKLLIKYDSFGNKKCSLYDEEMTKDTLKTKKLSQRKRVKSKNKSKCKVVISTRKPLPKVNANRIIRRFIQVHTFNETACFGLGELRSKRYIIAMNDVECLLVPRYWLLAHNDANIWNRILQYLKRSIPTTKDVFKAYVAERKWTKHKKDFSDSLIRKETIKHGFNSVPFSIKIKYNYADE